MKKILLRAMIIAAAGLLSSGTTYGQKGAAWKATLQKKTGGFNVPECMVVDSRNGQVFVSNIEAVKDKYWDDDGKGFISLLASDGTVKELRWRNSTKSAVINSPKGMCILKDQLYFTDNSRLMKLPLSGSGEPKEVKVPGAVRLNDSATDGKNIWVTDTGAGVIYRVDSLERVHRMAEIEAVNGVTCYKGKVYAVSWELHEVYEISPDGKGSPVSFNLAKHFTNLDGIEVLNDGSFVVSDFTGNKVSLISPDRKTVSTLIETESPADIGIDRKRGLFYVPSFMTNQVAVYELKSANVPSNEVQENVDSAALRRAIVDLIETFGSQYPRGAEYLQRLDELEARSSQLKEKSAKPAQPLRQAKVTLRREALLDNPLLDFEKLLAVKRSARSPKLGLPKNWQGNPSLPKEGYNDQIAVLALTRPDGELTTLFHPGRRFVGDVDLHFDGDRLLFSMPDDSARWQVYEVRVDGSGLRQLTGEQPDVDSYDACYLPSGKIIFSSTACFAGTPCVYGASHVANLYIMDNDGKAIRQLCFDQEHNWCPTVLNNGRILYTRWEYSDTPHSNTRLLFQMNPDGTEQTEYHGSNSYWPNSFFYSRPIPGHPSKVVSVIGGHHDNPRMGELVVFDSARGQREADGAVQRIPGYGTKVEPIIRDGLTKDSWPKFLHPFPLSDKYILVSCKPTPQSQWGIYLVDVFDNLVLIKELAGHALLEPIPLRKTTTPPVIADRVDLTRKDSTVFISDVYAGQGLRGIPSGTVKSLRIFSYHYAYQDMGGLLGVIGMDGPWDIKRVLGTVPVRDDGSAKFRVPANTPISIQPLDREGKALQLMRSWTTAMPGATVSCVGCHQSPRAAPQTRQTIAQTQPPDEIEPWYGSTRGFSYPREVQPVIDRYCVGCHDGRPQSNGSVIANLRGDMKLTDWRSITPGNGREHAGKFSVGYAELHKYVRRPGIESDYHMLEPMEFHADTTELVQMLRKGHHNVKLDDEAWDRLITWIDLNCPYHGTWGEELDDPGNQRQRRRELLKLYGGIDDDPEAVPETDLKPIRPILPDPIREQNAQIVECPNWPLDIDQAQRRQTAAGPVTQKSLDLGNGVKMQLTLIPAGEFVMGSLTGETDERPLSRVRIEKPFWIGACEVTNRQFNAYNPDHDSRVESKNTYQFGIHGYPVNRPEQPVVRVAWDEANAFCRWLSNKTDSNFTLPTEAQWEYACRAGTDTPFFFGDLNFSKFANMADAKLSEFASDPYTVNTPLEDPTRFDDWIPKDSRFNDGALLTVAPRKYQSNEWGIFDSHGNVSEWTRTNYLPYPYVTTDGRDDLNLAGRKVVRGGSWRDRPKRSTSSFRLSYQPYQRVYNVGFRVVCEAEIEE